jgi:hypothetical protein
MSIATLEIDPRFFITKSKFVTYEYSAYAERLGVSFVEKSCNVIRHQRTAAGVKERTWVDNYVVRLGYFFEALYEYLNAEAVSRPVSVESLTSKEWKEFGIWFGDRIRTKPLAPKTKSKHILTTNKLFSILAFAQVIPVKIELEPLTPSAKAKDSESRFTQKRWDRKSKPQNASSLFEIRIEKHRRSYDYTPYQPLASRFLLLVVPVLAVLYVSYSAGRAKKLHGSLTNFLRYLKDQKDWDISPDFFEALQSDRCTSIPDRQWETMIYRWRDSLIDSTSTDKRPSLITCNSKVKALAVIWDRLAGAGIVPKISIIGFKNARRKGASKSRRSLAQLTPNENLIEEGDQAIWSSIYRIFDHTEREEGLEFIRSLYYAIPAEELKLLSIEGMIEKIHELNSIRLNSIRKCAEEDFIRWYDHWKYGQAALEATTYSAEELVKLVDSPLLSVSERRCNSRNLLFSGPELCRLGNALLYVLATRNGIVWDLHGRYHHLIRTFGGADNFHAYLHPHPNATLALWVLLLVDTGANCEVVRKMPWNCLAQSMQPNCKVLKLGAKLRAGGKIIYDELSEVPEVEQQLSAIQAIEYYQRMAQHYRSQANANANDRLLLQKNKGEINELPEWKARGWFSEFLSRHKCLQGLNALPSMIRPSALMTFQHKNADRVVAAQIMADHDKPSTTLIHYTGRTPTKLKYNLLIREFQDRFQAVVIASINGAPNKLGLTEEEHHRILSDAARTGLGVACLNPLAGVQPGTKPGHDCTRLDACWRCNMRWVVATRENIADLIHFNEHLKVAQDSASYEHLETWEKRWLPWLVFSNIALTKLSQGETAKIFSEATALATERRINYHSFSLF